MAFRSAFDCLEDRMPPHCTRRCQELKKKWVDIGRFTKRNHEKNRCCKRLKSTLSISPEVILLVGSHAAIGSWNIHDAVMLETSRSLSGISFFMADQAFRYSIRNHMQMDKTVRLHAYIDKKFPNISAHTHTHTLSLEVCSHTLHCTRSTRLHWHSLASRKAHSDFPGGLLQHLFTLMSQKWSSSLPFQQLGQPAFWHGFKGLVLLLTVPA